MKKRITVVVVIVASIVVGNQVSDGRWRAVGAALDVAVAALVGVQVGQELDTQFDTRGGHQWATLGYPDDIRESASGTTRVTEIFSDSEGRTCRRFRQSITVGGVTRKGEGVACRDDSGTWHLVETH